ncbi:hypothetical protein ACWIGW_16430 [Nocardia brasiliensis]
MNQQLLLELRAAYTATQRSVLRLTDLGDLITTLSEYGDNDKRLAAEFVTYSRQILAQAAIGLETAYLQLGGYTPDDQHPTGEAAGESPTDRS